MSSFSEKISSLRNMVDNVETELKLLEGGRKTSSVRARKSLQDIKTACHDMRKDVTVFTQKLPTKPRSSKIAAPVVEPEPVAPESLPIPPVVEVVPVKPKPKPRRSKKVVVE